MYKCRICGMPKKGHVCKGPSQQSSGSSSKADASKSSSTSKEIIDPGVQKHIDVFKQHLIDLLDKARQSAEVSASMFVENVSRPMVSARPPAYPDAMNRLLDEVFFQYKNAIATAQEEFEAESHHLATMNANALKASNSGTTRVVEFQNDSFQWIRFTDQNAIDSILRMVDNTSLTNCLYTIGSHTYNASHCKLVGTLTQVNSHYNTKRFLRVLKAESSQAQVMSTPLRWEIDLYFRQWPIMLDDALYTALLQDYDYNVTNDMLNGSIAMQSSCLAKLCTIFDSFGNGINFKKCELWANPSKLSTFLQMARYRKHYELRLVAHGSSHQNYLCMRQDPLVFDHNTFSESARHGPGIYVSGSPHIALDYNESRNSGTTTHCKDTILLGLLLRRPSDSLHKTYLHYHLGSQSYPQEYEGETFNDAFVVRDSSYLLWLGMCSP